MRKLSAKEIRFQRRRNRSKGNSISRKHPRLVVFRSNKHIRAQIIDDLKGVTLVSASSLDKDLLKDVNKTESKVESSHLVGETIAKRALKKKVDKVVFDRNGYPYHGRIKAVADGARKAGLEF